jgi:hypothetical protein
VKPKKKRNVKAVLIVASVGWGFRFFGVSFVVLQAGAVSLAKWRSSGGGVSAAPADIPPMSTESQELARSTTSGGDRATATHGLLAHRRLAFCVA